MKPTIALTTYGRYEKDLATVYYNHHFSIPAHYIDAVRRAGGIPLLVTPGEEDWTSLLEAVDGLLITGGADIDPATYGGNQTHAQLTALDNERDQSETALIHHIVHSERLEIRTMPTLCVCRGMQVLNVALGGSLYEHVADVHPEDIHRGADGGWALHEIELVPTSRLSHAMGTTSVMTTSGHHQAIKEVASSLKIAAQAPDGVIEALEHEELPWLVGVQWHPEVTADVDSTQQRLFDALVDAADARRKRLILDIAAP